MPRASFTPVYHCSSLHCTDPLCWCAGFALSARHLCLALSLCLLNQRSHTWHCTGLGGCKRPCAARLAISLVEGLGRGVLVGHIDALQDHPGCGTSGGRWGTGQCHADRRLPSAVHPSTYALPCHLLCGNISRTPGNVPGLEMEQGVAASGCTALASGCRFRTSSSWRGLPHTTPLLGLPKPSDLV